MKKDRLLLIAKGVFVSVTPLTLVEALADEVSLPNSVTAASGTSTLEATAVINSTSNYLFGGAELSEKDYLDSIISPESNTISLKNFADLAGEINESNKDETFGKAWKHIENVNPVFALDAVGDVYSLENSSDGVKAYAYSLDARKKSKVVEALSQGVIPGDISKYKSELSEGSSIDFGPAGSVFVEDGVIKDDAAFTLPFIKFSKHTEIGIGTKDKISPLFEGLESIQTDSIRSYISSPSAME